jgi:hypothetical protein
MKRRVEIRIDRLVLDGLPAGKRRAVQEAVEREVAGQASVLSGLRKGSDFGIDPGPLGKAVNAALQGRRAK